MKVSNIRISKSVFIKTLVSFLLVMILLSAALSHTSLSISKRFLQDTTNAIRKDLLQLYQKEVENKIDILSQQINIFLMDPSVWQLIYSDPDELDFVLIREVLFKVQYKSYMDDIVDSVYLFDKQHDFILADSYYKKSEFYDSAIFTDYFISSEPISDVRTVDGRDLFSIIYRPLSTSGSNPVTLVVNIEAERLTDIISAARNLGTIVLINSRNNILYASDDTLPLAEIISQGDQLTENLGVVTANETEYLAARTEQSPFGIRFWIFQDYKTATYASALLSSMVLPVILLLFAAAVVLMVLVSYYLYRPMKALISFILKTTDTENLLKDRSSSEYALVAKVFGELVSTKNEIETKYKEASSFQDIYYLHEFLITSSFRRDLFEDILKRRNIIFDRPLYVLLIIDLQPSRNKALPRVPLPTNEGFLANRRVIVNQIDRERIAMIFNIQTALEVDAALLQTIEKWFNERGWEGCLCCSNAFGDISQLPMAYNYCERVLEQRFFYGKDDHAGDCTRSDLSAIFLNTPLEPELIKAVEERDREEAKQIMNEILDYYNVSICPEAIGYVRFKLMQICLNLLGLASNSANTLHSLAGNPFHEIFQHLRVIKTMSDTKEEMSRLIDLTIDHISMQEKNRNSRLVGRAKQYIAKNMNRSISLDDIAGAVFLTTNYFCSVFKTETGMTVMDYVMEKRIQRACVILLDQPRIQINTLAAQLGYNSVQSFIRQFKTVMHTTPDRYRKEHLMDRG